MQEKQLQAYKEVDKLLDSAQFPQAIEKMRPWSKVWLNQFHQTYPHRYRILRHEDFDGFWAERRKALNPRVKFAAQKRILDIDLVLGYVFYLFALKAKEQYPEAKFIEYLKLSLNFNSIHAAQTYLHKMILSNDEDKVKKTEAIAALLYNWENLASKHGTPGYLLLANGYLHLAQITSELKESGRYEAACFYLWKHLIQAELEESQSETSIHNAYFGEGLKLSNPEKIDTIETMKEKASQLILDESIKSRAEKTVRAAFIDNISRANLHTWLQSKNRAGLGQESSGTLKEDINYIPRF